MAYSLLHNHIKNRDGCRPTRRRVRSTKFYLGSGVEQIGYAKTPDQWTAWRRNLVVSMFNEWRASRQTG